MGSYPVSPHHTMSAGQSLYSYQDHLSWNLLFFFPFLSYSSFLSSAVTSSWKTVRAPGGGAVLVESWWDELMRGVKPQVLCS